MLCAELGWGLGLTAGTGAAIPASSTRELLGSLPHFLCEVVRLHDARPFSPHGTSAPGPEQGGWQRVWVL